jgi:hypothetical protein
MATAGPPAEAAGEAHHADDADRGQSETGRLGGGGGDGVHVKGPLGIGANIPRRRLLVTAVGERTDATSVVEIPCRVGVSGRQWQQPVGFLGPEERVQGRVEGHQVATAELPEAGHLAAEVHRLQDRVGLSVDRIIEPQVYLVGPGHETQGQPLGFQTLEQAYDD